MAKNDFDILIGLDIEKTSEKSVNERIAGIAKTYPVKFELSLEGNDKLVAKVQSLLDKTYQLEFDFDMSDANKELNDFEKKSKETAKNVNNDVENLTAQQKKYKNELKETSTQFDNLMRKSMKKTDKKETKTTRKGNKFSNSTIVEVDKEPFSTETIKDFASLESYTDQLTKKTSQWRFVTEHVGDEYNKLVQQIGSLRELLNNNPVKFDETIKSVKELERNLEQLENNYSSKLKNFDSSKNMFDKSDLSFVKKTDRNKQQRSLASLESKVLDSNVSNGDYQKEIDIFITKQRELQNINKENVSRNKELVKLQETLNGKIKEWRKDAHLSKEDIDSFRDSFKKLSIYSDDFDKNLKKVKENFVKLSKKEIKNANNEIIKSSKKEWKALEKDVMSRGFVDGKDFEKVNALMGNLSAESKRFKTDLKEVSNELNKVVKLSDRMEKKQGSIEATQLKNRSKLTGISDNNIVPKHLLDEVNSSNDMLDFSSKPADIQRVNNEIKTLKKLEQDIIKEDKEESAIRKLIADAEQSLVKSSNKYLDQLDKISYNSKSQLEDENRIVDVQNKISEIEAIINKQKESGLAIDYQQHRLIQGKITDLQREFGEHKKMEQSLRKEANELQTLEKTFESVSFRSLKSVERSKEEYKQIKRIVDEIAIKIKGLGSLTGNEFKKARQEIEGSMIQLSRESGKARDAMNNKENSFFGKFGHAMRQVPIWISAMTVFYGTMRQVQMGFQNLLDVDKAMISLKKVTSATNEELEQFKDTSSIIGMELGVLISDVMTATSAFQKLGFSLQQSSQLGQNSILYANVGEMSVEDATQNIISAVKGFNIEVDDSGRNVTKLVDIFNEVGNNYAISSEGIGEALRRSSAVLSGASNSVEQSVALVTAANATIQDPLKVGNAMKTISMRLRGVEEDGSKVAGLVPELEKTFNSFGKSIMKDENTFKSTFEIFSDLSSVFSGLTDIQQANIVELIGGKEQGAIVESMINNWSDAMGSYETALNSAGSAQREFRTYMEGFEYKIGQLKVAMEEFWVTLINDDATKGFIDFLTQSVQGMTKLVEIAGSGNLATFFTSMFLLFGSSAIKGKVFDIGGKLKPLLDSARGIEDVGKKVAETEVATATLSKGTSLLSGGFKKLLSLVGFLAKRFLGYISIIFLVVGAIKLLIDWKNKERNTRKENVKNLDNEIQKYEQLAKKYKDLNVDRFVELDFKKNDKSQGLNTDELQEYTAIQNDIKDNMPELIQYYDEHGNAVLKDAGAIKKLIEDSKELYELNKSQSLELKVEDTDFSKLDNAIQKAKDAFNKIQQSQDSEESFSFAKKFINDEIKGLEQGTPEYVAKVTELKEKMKEIMGDNDSLDAFNARKGLESALDTGDFDKVTLFLNNHIKSVQNGRKKLNEEYDGLKSNVSLFTKEFSAILDESLNLFANNNGIKVDSNEYLFLSSFKTQLENELDMFGDMTPKEIAQKFDEILADVSGHVDMGKLLELKNPKEITNAYDDVIKRFSKESKYGREVIAVLRAMKTEQIATAKASKENPAVDFSGEASAIMNQYYEDVNSLNSAYQTLSDGQKLSVQQITQLTKDFPELNNQVKLHNGVLSISASAIKKVMELREKSSKASIGALKAEAEASKAKAKIAIGSMLSEAKAEQILSLVKTKSAQAAIDALPSAKDYLFNGGGIPRDVMEKSQNAKKAILAYADLSKEIASLGQLMNSDWSVGMPSGGSSSKDKKGADKAKQSLTDMIYVADKYKQRMDEVNNLIERQQKAQERLADTSVAYRKSLTEEIRIDGKKKEAIDAQVRSLEKQIRNKKIQQTGLITVGKDDDNKTARAKNAELQSEIDKTREIIAQLKNESIDVANRIIELRWSIVESNLKQFELTRKTYEDDIAYTEYIMNLYGEQSDGYEKYANVKLTYQRKQLDLHKQELAYLEKEYMTDKNLSAKQRTELEQSIRDERMAIYDLSSNIIGLETTIANDKIGQILETYSEESNAYADKISEIRDKLKYDFDEGDYASQISSLRQIESLYLGQREDAKKHIKALEDMKLQYKDNVEVTKKINDEIKSWSNNMKQADNSAKDIAKEIEGLYSNLANTYVDLYKEQMDLMRKAEEDRYNDTMEAESKSHDLKMKNLDEEMDKIREAYEEQMKMIDRGEDSRTFGNELQDLQKEARDLQSEIDKWSLDKSYEGMSKTSELQKQLTEKNKEILEKEHGRQIDLRKQDLDDALATEEDKNDATKDMYQEDYDNFVEVEEKKKEARDDYWEERMNDERTFAKMREEVEAGSFGNMLNNLTNWKVSVSNEMSTLGTVVSNNFTDKIQEAIDSLTQLNSMDIGGMDAPVSPVNVDAPVQEHVDLPSDRETVPSALASKPVAKPAPKPVAKPPAKPKPKPVAKPKPTPRYYTIKSGDTLGALALKYYKSASQWVKIKNANPSVNPNNLKIGSRLLIPFKTGGYTGEWGSDGRLGILHQKELVLNQLETKDILETVKITDKLRHTLPNFDVTSKMPDKTSDKNDAVQYINNYDLSINVEKSSNDRKTAEMVGKQTLNMIKRTKGGKY